MNINSKAMIIIKVLIVILIITRIAQYTKDEASELPLYAKKYVIRIKELVNCQFADSQVSITVNNCQQYREDELLLVTGTTPPWLKKDLNSTQLVTVLETKTISLSEARVLNISRWLENHQKTFRHSIIFNLTTVMPEEYATFSLLLVFGGSLSEFGQETKDVIVASGLAHVVAASGMNVAFVLMLVRLWRFQHRAIQFLLTFMLVLGYAVLAGGEPPVVRAALGAIFQEAGTHIWLRLGRPLHLLLTSAALQLFISPQLITSISFQLSYAASFGILAIFPLVNNLHPSRPLTKLHINRSDNNTIITTIFAYIKTTLLITICCWMMVAPLLAYNFGTVTLTTIMTGLLTTWSVPIAFVLSASAMAVSGLAEMLPPMQLLFSAQAQILMLLESFFFWSARMAAGLDSLQQNWNPTLWQISIWYAVILISWWRIGRLTKLTNKTLSFSSAL